MPSHEQQKSNRRPLCGQVAYCLPKNVLMCLHQTEVFIVYRKCIDLLWSKQGYVLIICDQVVMDYKSKPKTLDFFRSLADVCMKRLYSDCLLTCEVIKIFIIMFDTIVFKSF